MDPRVDAAPSVAELYRATAGLLTGLYVGGSLATGDYRPGISDIDAVASLDAAPGRALRRELTQIHRRIARELDDASGLRCAYVSIAHVADVRHRHWTWAFGELFRRPLSLIARAELLADPVVLLGPPPTTWLSPMSTADLRERARAELAGYWTRALRKRAIWLQDTYVDLGLTVWARADATISDGVLITKTEAIARMAERGVPADVVEGVAARRAGRLVTLTDAERAMRARVVRQFLTAELARLLGD